MGDSRASRAVGKVQEGSAPAGLTLSLLLAAPVPAWSMQLFLHHWVMLQ